MELFVYFAIYRK